MVGIRDVAIAKCLQLDTELTLEKAKRLMRQNEAVQDNQRQLKGDRGTQNPIIIDGVVKYPDKPITLGEQHSAHRHHPERGTSAQRR